MKDLKYYLSLPYTVMLRRDAEGDFVARVDELPGCAAHGKTAQKALENLEEAKTLWVSDCIESGDIIPEPAIEDALPSGKWVQRVPRSLHRKLVSLAKRERVSLNHLVTVIVSETVGARKVEAREGLAKESVEEALSPSPWRMHLEALEEEFGDWLILQDPTPDMPFLYGLRLLSTKIRNSLTTKFEVTEGGYEEKEAHQVKR